MFFDEPVRVGISLQEELMVNRGMMHCKNKLNEVGRRSPSFEKLAEAALIAMKTCLHDSGISTPLAIVFHANAS